MAKFSSSVAFAVGGFTEADAAAVAARVPGEGTPLDKMSRVCASLLRDLIKGGVMIDPDSARRIEAAIGTAEPEDIMKAVEKSAGQEGGTTIVRFPIDPTQVPWYQSLADNQGITLDHQIKNCMDHAYSQGWFGINSPEPYKLLLSREQYQSLQKLFSRDIVTGSDVIGLIDFPASTAPAVHEEDFALDGLGG